MSVRGYLHVNMNGTRSHLPDLLLFENFTIGATWNMGWGGGLPPGQVGLLGEGVRTYARTHTSTHTHARMQAHTHVTLLSRAHTQVLCVRVCMCVFVRVCMLVCVCVC